MAGGLLGHWSVWTKAAVETLELIKQARVTENFDPAGFAELASQVTEMNHFLFDFDNGFRGCISGVHDILRRQGLLEGTWCLNPNEVLSPRQAEALTRVSDSYSHLTDDVFVAENLDRWMSN